MATATKAAKGKAMTQGALAKALAQQLETTPAQSKEFLNVLATIATPEVKQKHRFRQHSRPLHDQAIREGRRLEGQKSAR